MPLCDAYIPANALNAEVEHQLIARVTDILVSHEMRRIVELMDDSSEVEASAKRANAIAWTFVHRTETYVAGQIPDAPYYRFIASIPEGQLDDEFIPAINRDIMQAVVDAEAGKWPNPERRVWIFAQEIPDGTWGAGGRPLHLEQIIDFVSPGWGHAAVERWEAKKGEQAAALLQLAAAAGTPA